jgi:lipopolysaccharide transport system ATP-binding protein
VSNFAIQADGLSKRYKIGHRVSSNATLRDALMRTVKFQFFRDWKNSFSNDEYVWALRDVSFVVDHGEAIGIIGHNGSGKSTLLKLLSRITEPTTGNANIYGRIGSLLEVGTGFHQELTGRENVFLSGAILGMKRNDIKLRFDEIVEFAGVAQFIDTPVKHYSSGMFLRLAFAVAAHLEPDILLVDEVLAVGDLEFQKKCLNKMSEVATQGRTVLFVSHNMGSVKELCKTAIVLKNGMVDFHGGVAKAIQHYSRNVANGSVNQTGSFSSHGWVGLRIAHQEGTPRIANTEPFEIDVRLSLAMPLEQVGIHCFIEDSEGTEIVHNREVGLSSMAKGQHRVRATFPPLHLRPGIYTLYLKLVGESRSVMVRHFSERLLLDVTDKTQIFNGKVRALIIPPATWSVESISSFEKVVEFS